MNESDLRALLSLKEGDLRAIFNLGSIGAMAALCRLALGSDERTFFGFLGFFIPGVFAGMMAGFAVQGHGFAPGWESAIVSASALAAKEILLALITAADTLRQQAPKITKSIINKRFGK